MADIAWSAISGGSQVVRKSIVINSSQNWAAPINLAGNQCWVTGSAGGGAGAGTSAPIQHAIGGSSGGYCDKFSVPVTAGSTYLVTIGAGGTSSGTAGSDGGDTSFGSLVLLKGGKGGVLVTIASPTVAESLAMANISGGAIAQKILLTASASPSIGGFTERACLNGNSSGATTYDAVDSQFATGGAAGFFGAGTDGSVIGNATNAANNTGAGGGAAAGAGTSGAGGSGKLIIEWDEFL